MHRLTIVVMARASLTCPAFETFNARRDVFVNRLTSLIPHKVKCVSVTPARKSISGVGIAV